MATVNGNCNCLHGIPIIDANGNCQCLDTTQPSQVYPAGTGGIKPIPGGQPQTVNHYHLPAGQQTDNSIFGFSPLVILGAAAVGLFFLSSMDGKQ